MGITIYKEVEVCDTVRIDVDITDDDLNDYLNEGGILGHFYCKLSQTQKEAFFDYIKLYDFAQFPFNGETYKMGKTITKDQG